MNRTEGSDTRPVLAILCNCPDPKSGRSVLRDAVGDQAVEQFRTLCLDLLQKELPLLHDIYDLAICPSREEDREWVELKFPYAEYVIPQPEGAQGERLHTIVQALRTMGHEKVVVLGADCPSLPMHYLRVIRRLFRDKDAVIGPTQNGDVYVFGVGKDVPELESVHWGSADTFGELASVLSRHGMKLGIAPPWYRVTDEHAFHRAAEDLQISHSLARQQFGMWIESVVEGGMEVGKEWGDRSLYS
ncbi:MAG: DUF2064 domain-containing protein [Candidatus Eisenbacteria bacterium]|nr:DUF2064 domain-containing protein [Candidatus Eisenbacteria bacterium]